MRLLDVVAITTDVPEHGLMRGHVGTIVEELDNKTYEVEFCDEHGTCYAQVAVPMIRLFVLHHRPVQAL
jgi:hypothetical protein